MKKAIYFLLPIIFILNGCGNSFRVYHDLDSAAKFEDYKTYSFLDWTEGNKKVVNGMELERIRTAFARELESKGLKFQAENADLKVQITVYFKESRHPNYGYYYHPMAQYNYMERALAIDIFEKQSKKQVWHSAAVGPVANTPEKRQEELPGQVEEMLASYPAMI